MSIGNTVKEKTGIVNDVNEVVSGNISDGTMILMYTDRFVCCKQQNIEDIPHLLEARVFNSHSEIKIMRPTIADDFYYRFIDDDGLESEWYIDEVHYLDIDLDNKKTSGNHYVTTGGGEYDLPVEGAERVHIRNYISFDDQDIAQISDFRVVEFLKKGGE